MSFPVCPHCGHEFDSEDIWHTGSTNFPKEDDGDITKTTCLSCERPLTIMLSLNPEWVFLDEGDNEIEYGGPKT